MFTKFSFEKFLAWSWLDQILTPTPVDVYDIFPKKTTTPKIEVNFFLDLVNYSTIILFTKKITNQ